MVKITPPPSNENGWHNNVFTIVVSVTDIKDINGAEMTSGGIDKIIWKEGETGTAQTIEGLPGTSDPVYEKEFTIPVTTDGTHTYYVKAADNAGNDSGWHTVTARVDTKKPEFITGPSVTKQRETGADISFIPSEGVKAYWIVSNEETAPGAQEVKEKSGQDSILDAEKDTACSFTIGRLTPEEKYTIYVVLEDAAGNLSEVKEKSFFTLPKSPEVNTFSIDPAWILSDPNAGIIEKDVEVMPGAPEAMLSDSKDKLAKSVLTKEELAEINSGVNARIWLEIAPDVEISKKEKAQVQKAAEQSVGAGVEVTYFDASLFKQIGNGEKRQSIKRAGQSPLPL